MKLKMLEEDRRALDLLLDRSATAANRPAGAAVFASPADPDLRKRVSRIEKVLSLLDNMPPVDPPRDLVQQTLRLIERRERGDAAEARMAPAAYRPQTPMA